MHAAIELAKKNVRVYSQREWYNVIHMARRHKPYVVYQLDFSSFFDLEKVKNDLIVNKNKDTDGATVNWMEIHSIRFKKDSPFSFLYAYEPMGEYRKVVTKVQPGRRSKPATLVQLYTKQLAITAAKKRTLCSFAKLEPYLMTSMNGTTTYLLNRNCNKTSACSFFVTFCFNPGTIQDYYCILKM